MVEAGRYRFQCGDEQFELTEGDTIFLPRGVPHTFCQLGDSGRLRFLYTPAGAMEHFFRALAQLPGPPAPEVGAALFAAHGNAGGGPALDARLSLGDKRPHAAAPAGLPLRAAQPPAARLGAAAPAHPAALCARHPRARQTLLAAPGRCAGLLPARPEWIGAGLAPATTRKARAALIGQPSQVTLRQGGCDFSVYQIEFEPGALYRLTGLPLDQLVDTWVDAEAVFPPPFSGLVDQLQALDAPLPQIAAAEAWLLHRIARVRQAARPADALAARLVVEGPARIDALAREHGLDTRQLRRQFVQRVGVSPKLLARIARFDHVIRLANAAPMPTGSTSPWTPACTTTSTWRGISGSSR